MTRTAPLPIQPIEPPATSVRQEIPAAPPISAPTPESLSPDLRLVIEEDASTNTYVYKTINRVTGEILQQFPRDQVLKMRSESDYRPGKIVKTGI